MLHNEPGVFLAFEETAEELAQNVRSLGFDLDRVDRAQRSWRSITFTSSAAKSRRRGSTTSKDCSSAWGTPSPPSAPSGSCSTHAGDTVRRPVERHDPAGRTALRLFRWLKAEGVDRRHHRQAGQAALCSPGTAWKSMSPTACCSWTSARCWKGKNLDSAAADCEVPRLRPRHERVSVPDRRGRYLRFFQSPRCSCSTRHPKSSAISSGVPALDAMLGGPGVLPRKRKRPHVRRTAGVGKTSLACSAADAVLQPGRTMHLWFIALYESEAQLLPQYAVDRPQSGTVEQKKSLLQISNRPVPR